MRIDAFDIVKWFAILAVVVGHFVDLSTQSSDTYRSIFIFIYAFHMPLFIFMSGLFDHPRGHFPAKQVVFFLAAGLALKIVISITSGIVYGRWSFSLFIESGVPWFMFALAVWKSICFFLRDSKCFVVLPLAILSSLMIGYSNENTDLLCISRIMVFFPFYYVGYLMNPNKVIALLNRRVVAILGLAVIAVFAILCFFQLDLVYQLRGLFTGRNSYEALGMEMLEGPALRVLTYAISVILCIALISIASFVRCFLLARWGRNTLAVYFWHYPLMMLLDGIGVTDCLLGHFPGGYIWVLLGIMVTIICSQSIAMRPLAKMREGLAGQ